MNYFHYLFIIFIHFFIYLFNQMECQATLIYRTNVKKNIAKKKLLFLKFTIALNA